MMTVCGDTPVRGHCLMVTLFLHSERDIKMVHNAALLRAGVVLAVIVTADDDDVELNVLGCRLTYKGRTVSNAEAWFNVALRPQKP